MARILLVEDELELSKLVANWLSEQLHVVVQCADGGQALSLLQQEHFDVILLDIMLPVHDGVEICRRFRKGGGTTPILLLSAKRTLKDKERGLDSGADDYLTKPFKLRELSARVRALLRRQPVISPTILEAGELSLNTDTNRVFRGTQEVKLMPKEFSLLKVLLQSGGIIVRNETLISSVWGSQNDISPETIRSYIRLLRQKIDGPGPESIIETVHGVGYRIAGNMHRG